jgi:hypothetical protein
VRTLLFVLIVAIFMFAVSLLAKAHLRSRCRKSAAKIYRELAAVFTGEHEFRVVPADEAARQPAAREENGPKAAGELELQAALGAAGFRLLGWIEDLTTRAVYPHLSAITECHASADGRTCATIMRTAGLLVFELGTRLPGDRFVMTSNAEMNRLQPPPSTDREILSYGTSFETLHTRHLQRLAERGADPAHVIPCRELADAIASFRLYSIQASAYRRTIGYLTREELLELGAGVQREAVVSLVWEEFCRLREGERRAA